MNIKITCPKRWAEAREKAAELRTDSLDKCLLRVIEFAMAKPWQIEEAKRLSEEAYRVFAKWSNFFERHRDDDLRSRAYNVKWRMWDKFQEVNRKYIDLAGGGTLNCYISSDYAPLSFYFCVELPDGSMWLNGGVIFSDRTNSWSIHT